MRHILLVALLTAVCACSTTTRQPLSINSPQLDSGIRGNGGDGLGGEAVVGRSGGGLINRVTVP